MWPRIAPVALSILIRPPENSHVREEPGAVGGPIGVVDPVAGSHVDRPRQLPRRAVVLVDPVAPFSHHDCRGAVGGEVQVVGGVDPNRPTHRLTGRRVDRHERVGIAGRCVQVTEIPVGDDVLHELADVVRVDDLHGGLIDDRHRAGVVARHVDVVPGIGDRWAQLIGDRVGVDAGDRVIGGGGWRRTDACRRRLVGLVVGRRRHRCRGHGGGHGHGGGRRRKPADARAATSGRQRDKCGDEDGAEFSPRHGQRP